MGKRSDDLPLDDTPIRPEQQHLFEPTDSSGADGADDADTPWYQFIGSIDDLLATGRYGWAQDSLYGIRETVEKTRRVSDGQRRAVTNIELRGEPNARGGSRRYEGWSGRGW